jgi:hypothetical protein
MSSIGRRGPGGILPSMPSFAQEKSGVGAGRLTDVVARLKRGLGGVEDGGLDGAGAHREPNQDRGEISGPIECPRDGEEV